MNFTPGKAAKLLLAFLLVASAAGSQAELSPLQKQRLVAAIGERLERKAYAFDTDFSQWETFAAQRQSEIDAAQTKEELAAALAAALAEFELSHLGVFAPSADTLRRKGQRAGIGITIHPLEGGNGLISYVLEGSPGYRCGLRKGDVLTAIDGEPYTDINQLAGDVGDKRQLTWLRNGAESSCEIEYATFSLSEESSMAWIRDDVALIRIQSFQYRFYKLTRINTFFREARKAKAIIIDLRNNRGGLSLYSRHLASKIASRKETFALRTRKTDTRPKAIRPLPFSNPYKGKIVVLVDALSASAADILPAFVSETGRGIVIGQRTGGALQLARIYPLPYGFRLYLPVAELLTPKGQRLEASGFRPDIELSLAESIEDETIFKIALEVIDGRHDPSE